MEEVAEISGLRLGKTICALRVVQNQWHVAALQVLFELDLPQARA